MSHKNCTYFNILGSCIAYVTSLQGLLHAMNGDAEEVNAHTHTHTHTVLKYQHLPKQG